MTFDEWLKSPGRNERLVKVELQPGVTVEMVCRVNSKREFFDKLQKFMPNDAAAWDLFAGEWFCPTDHAKRIFESGEDLETKLSPDMIDRLMEAWTIANAGKSLGEMAAPVMMSPESRSGPHGSFTARRSESLISTIWNRLFRWRR